MDIYPEETRTRFRLVSRALYRRLPEYPRNNRRMADRAHAFGRR